MIERFGEYQKGRIYCTQCGNPNRMGNQYCDSCGVNIDEYSLDEFSVEESSVRIIAIHESQITSAFQLNHSRSVTPVKLHPQNKKEVTPKGIFGLVSGLLSIIAVYFLRNSPLVSLTLSLSFMLLATIGAICSGRSIDENKTMNKIGLALNIIGIVIHCTFLHTMLFFSIF